MAGDAVRVIGEVPEDTTARIDRVVLNRVLGIPIFLAVMYLMFMFTINIGSAFIRITSYNVCYTKLLRTVSFRCRVAERDAVVLNNGLCLLNG